MLENGTGVRNAVGQNGTGPSFRSVSSTYPVDISSRCFQASVSGRFSYAFLTTKPFYPTFFPRGVPEIRLLPHDRRGCGARERYRHLHGAHVTFFSCFIRYAIRGDQLLRAAERGEGGRRKAPLRPVDSTKDRKQTRRIPLGSTSPPPAHV